MFSLLSGDYSPPRVEGDVALSTLFVHIGSPFSPSSLPKTDYRRHLETFLWYTTLLPYVLTPFRNFFHRTTVVDFDPCVNGDTKLLTYKSPSRDTMSIRIKGVPQV